MRWGYMPAMMKGNMDRIFSRGFAYDVNADNSVAKHVAQVRQPPLKPQSPGCGTNRNDAV